jgi:hypothetical protein
MPVSSISHLHPRNPRNPCPDNLPHHLHLVQIPRGINHNPARLDERKRKPLAPPGLNDGPRIRIRQPDMQRVLRWMRVRNLVVQNRILGLRIQLLQIRSRVNRIRGPALRLRRPHLQQLRVLFRQRLHHRLHPLSRLRVDLLWPLALGHRPRGDLRSRPFSALQACLQIPGPVGFEGRGITQVVGAHQPVQAELGHPHVASPGGRRSASAEALPFLEVPHCPREAEDEGPADCGCEGILGDGLGCTFEQVLVRLGDAG